MVTNLDSDQQVCCSLEVHDILAPHRCTKIQALGPDIPLIYTFFISLVGFFLVQRLEFDRNQGSLSQLPSLCAQFLPSNPIYR